MSQPTHSDLHIQIAQLTVELRESRSDIAELKKLIGEQAKQIAHLNQATSVGRVVVWLLMTMFGAGCMAIGGMLTAALNGLFDRGG